MTAGLSAVSERWTKLVLARVKARGFAKAAGYVAIETCIAESGLKMYANGNNPASLALPHDAVGWDHGSVGLFQQQVGGAVNSTANWGTTAQCMDVNYSTDVFLNALSRFNWASVPRWTAAQHVQGSNDPSGGNYAKNDKWAVQIVDSLWGGPPVPVPVGVRPWPTYMPWGHYFGLISGPMQSHGGYFAGERADVRAIQVRLQVKGFAPNVAGWADGVFEQPTLNAVAAWQRRFMPGTRFWGQVWADDWYKLMR